MDFSPKFSFVVFLLYLSPFSFALAGFFYGRFSKESFVSWSELSDEEKAEVNNGCGASWFPEWLKKFADKYLFSWLFHAQCGHHDFGYLVGGSEFRRMYCDYRFLMAMNSDIVFRLRNGQFMLAFVGLFVSYFFYCLVALFGWLSFEYGHKNNKAEVLSIVRYTWARSKLSERLRDFKLW